MSQTAPSLVTQPATAREAAVRYAALVFLGRQQIPTLDELAAWSGLKPTIALAELRRWHPELARLIAGQRH